MKTINLLIEAIAIESAKYSDKQKAELLLEIAKKINSTKKDKILQEILSPENEEDKEEVFEPLKTLSSFTDGELEQNIISALGEEELTKVDIVKKLNLTPGSTNQKRFNSVLSGLRELGIVVHNLKAGKGSKFRLKKN